MHALSYICYVLGAKFKTTYEVYVTAAYILATMDYMYFNNLYGFF